MTIHPRGIVPLLGERLRHRSVVVLTGSRQAGKTTLVRELLPAAADRPVRLISLDDADERLRLGADPVRLLDHPDTIVALDEIQKAPRLLDAVKLLADRGARRRFVLLGSSQILLLEKVRESLAGRASLVELWPLAMAERVDGSVVPAPALAAIWERGEKALAELEQDEPASDVLRRLRGLEEEQLGWGGYPALEALPEGQKRTWLRDFRRTYLERDIGDLGRVADLDQFALAQSLLAARTGQLLSHSEVSRELGLAVNTVKRYVHFLELSYQVLLLRPVLPNVTSRLVKSPKLYWTDPGLARVLAERPDRNDGAIFETAVCAELFRWRSWQEEPPEIGFHRTSAGREIDFILHGPGSMVAIEAKAGSSIPAGVARSLETFLDEVRLPGRAPKSKRTGIVVYRGRAVKRLLPRVWAVPFSRLFGAGVSR